MARTSSINNWRQRVESTATQVVQCESVLPVDTDSNRNPLVFNIRSAPGLVVDAKNIKLSFSVTGKKLKEGKWVNLEKDDKVAPYNNFGFSLFEDVQLFMGGTLVETSMREYSRSSYIRNLLFTSEQEQLALESAFLFKDDPVLSDVVIQDHKNNMWQGMRASKIKDGKPMTVHTPVYMDILQSAAYIPDHTDMTLRFYPAKTNKCVLQTKSKIVKADKTETEDFLQVKLIITRAELHVPRSRLTVPILKNISSNFDCCKVFNYVSPKGIKTFSCSLNSDKLPTKVAIVLVSEGRYEGELGKNGLYFHHHQVSNVTVKSNNRVLPTLNGLNTNPEESNWAEAYTALFEQLGSKNPNMHLTTFDNGNAIFGVNLQPTSDKKMAGGTCDIDIGYQRAPTKNLVILIFCYYDGKYAIDKNGNFTSSVNAKI